MRKLINGLVDYLWFGSETKRYYKNKETFLRGSFKDDPELLEISLCLLRKVGHLHFLGARILPVLADVSGIMGYVSTRNPSYLFLVVAGEAYRSFWDYGFYKIRKREERKEK